MDCSLSRLRRLSTLSLSGTDVGDLTLSLISQHLSLLVELDLSYCIKITNRGIVNLADKKAVLKVTLAHVNFTSCKQVRFNCSQQVNWYGRTIFTIVNSYWPFRDGKSLKTLVCGFVFGHANSTMHLQQRKHLFILSLPQEFFP